MIQRQAFPISLVFPPQGHFTPRARFSRRTALR